MYERLIESLKKSGAWVATKYVSPNEVIRATRKYYRAKPGRYKGHFAKHLDLVLTHGKPNYREREFIRQCKKAGEPLPVKKIQLRYAPRTVG